MKHYKSPDNAIYAYELDGSQDHLIPDNFVLLTQEELDEIRKIQYQEWLDTQPTKEKQIAELQKQIDALKE
jgi:protein tyrosine phosphatase